MGQIFLKTFIIMAALLAFIVPGYVLKRKNLMGDGAAFTLSNILLYVCQPAMIISSFCVFSDEAWAALCELSHATLAMNFGIVALISALAMGAMFGIAKLVFIKAKDRSAANIYTYIAVFSNCGFLGVPFIEMFTDGDPVAVLYIIVFNIVFITMSWTLGVFLVSGDAKNISAKKILLNPSILASAVAILLFFVPKLNFFMLPVLKDLRILPRYLSYMTTPVAMLIVGVRLADMPMKALFTDAGSYVAGGLRLVAAPFVTCLIAYAAFAIVRAAGAAGDLYVYIAPIIAMVMTPASSVIAMAERFGGNKSAATTGFTVNTLISIVTIPLVMMAIMAIWL